ncbi:unnamed protein product [Echinostoma caproni]|uniref:DUF4704 domain-containing protein n=1 Tax=Echinostoma caproni TaxID=27848 RepID=A0A183B778_9TREM|nr:unnamed protein product [Echinostoma caproni]
MDPVNQFLRYVAIKLFGIMLNKTNCTNLERDSLGFLFLTNPWNGILVELLQAGVFLNPLPNLSIHFVEFLVALLSTNNAVSLIWIEKHVLTKLMMVFVHHLDEYPTEIGNSIRVLARTLALCSNLDVLSNEDRLAVQVKLNTDLPPESTPSLLQLFKIFLNETIVDR